MSLRISPEKMKIWKEIFEEEIKQNEDGNMDSEIEKALEYLNKWADIIKDKRIELENCMSKTEDEFDTIDELEDNLNDLISDIRIEYPDPKPDPKPVFKKNNSWY